MKTLSTESYKGVRDFYPHDQFIHEYLLNTLATTCEQFGYEAYGASILEPAEIYRTKTSDEIVDEQTYTFTDRGGREVTLRPEMTPTVARMVARRSRELGFPLRLYSLPNCFRYERTQRGRLREFWQLNADLFGLSGIEADVEIIALAHALFSSFGATSKDFEIRVNDRRVFEHIFDELQLSIPERKQILSLLDRRAKIDNFPKALNEIITDTDTASKLLALIDSAASNPLLVQLQTLLTERGITNAIIDTTIVRGFDYYTDMVFEVFDISPENNRSLAGGGRYNALTEMFGSESIPTVGFALGDVTLQDFLATRDLLPSYTSPTDIMLCVLTESDTTYADSVAQILRTADVNVAVNYSYKKAGDQIKLADKKKIPFTACVGQKEQDQNILTVKNLATGEETSLAIDSIAEFVISR